ncbi:MAG: OapB/ArvB family protein [Candidatus Woesearchaeota archaeon]
MLTIHYLPYQQIRTMSSHDRIELILSLLRSDRIIIIDGRLNSKDEAVLIRETMSSINEEFHGMEFGVLHDHTRADAFSKFKQGIYDRFTGNSSGLTIIGPASIIGEMRQYQDNVVLHFGDEYFRKYSKNLGAKKSNNNSENRKRFK